MKKIRFIGGYEEADMLLHIAKILTALGIKTVVIDSTINQKAKYVVPVINPTTSYITEFEEFDVAVGFKNFDAMEQYLGLGETEELEYDIALIDTDSSNVFSAFRMEDAYINYFVTSFDLFSLKKGLEILSGLREEIKMTKVLFSKYMTNEEDDYLNYLSKEYKITWSDIKIYFPFEIGDKSAIIENQRVSKIKFRNLSSQYKESILFMVEQIIGNISTNELRKIMKSIEKGV